MPLTDLEARKEYCKQYYLLNKDKILAHVKKNHKKYRVDKKLARKRQLQYRKLNPHRCIYNRARRRSMESGLPFDIELTDIIIPSFCPILGVPIFVGSSSFQINSPSIDRIDSTLGYTKNNIQIISNRANLLKRDASLEEMVKLGDWAKEQLCQKNK